MKRIIVKKKSVENTNAEKPGENKLENRIEADNRTNGKISFEEIQQDGLKNLYGKDKHVFPVHVFPASIREFILEAEKIIGFPRDYLSGGVLVATATAIGKSFQVKAKSEWIEKAIIFLALVGPRGINKTHPLDYAFRPLKGKDEKLYKSYIEDCERYEEENQAYQSSKKKQGSKKPKHPVLKQNIVSDVTIEALALIHENNPKGLCYNRDELIGWINDFARYNNSTNEDKWLSLFNGKGIIVDRKNGERKHIRIKDTFVSVCGTIQNEIVGSLFSGPRKYNGFADRILFIMPEDLKKPEHYIDKEISKQVIEGYNTIIRILCDLPYNPDQTKILTYTEESKKMLNHWYSEIAKNYNQLPKNDVRKGIISKMEIYIHRFALILQLMHWAENPTKNSNEKIERLAMEGAIALVEYFSVMALKARNEAVKSFSLKGNEKKIAAWVLKAISVKQYTFRQIGEILNVSHVTVENWIKELAKFGYHLPGKRT